VINCDSKGFKIEEFAEFLSEVDVVCRLKSMKLIVSIPSEDVELAKRLGAAIRKLDLFFSSISSDFKMETKLCSCGGIMPERPYWSYSDALAKDCGFCLKRLPSVCFVCQKAFRIKSVFASAMAFRAEIALPSFRVRSAASLSLCASIIHS
jgi:hypothetical protein